jgi:hypothetical protein
MGDVWRERAGAEGTRRAAEGSHEGSAPGRWRRGAAAWGTRWPRWPPRGRQQGRGCLWHRDGSRLNTTRTGGVGPEVSKELKRGTRSRTLVDRLRYVLAHGVKASMSLEQERGPRSRLYSIRPEPPPPRDHAPPSLPTMARASLCAADSLRHLGPWGARGRRSTGVHVLMGGGPGRPELRGASV